MAPKTHKFFTLTLLLAILGFSACKNIRKKENEPSQIIHSIPLKNGETLELRNYVYADRDLGGTELEICKRGDGEIILWHVFSGIEWDEVDISADYVPVLYDNWFFLTGKKRGKQENYIKAYNLRTGKVAWEATEDRAFWGKLVQHPKGVAYCVEDGENPIQLVIREGETGEELARKILHIHPDAYPVALPGGQWAFDAPMAYENGMPKGTDLVWLDSLADTLCIIPKNRLKNWAWSSNGLAISPLEDEQNTDNFQENWWENGPVSIFSQNDCQSKGMTIPFLEGTKVGELLATGTYTRRNVALFQGEEIQAIKNQKTREVAVVSDVPDRVRTQFFGKNGIWNSYSFMPFTGEWNRFMFIPSAENTSWTYADIVTGRVYRADSSTQISAPASYFRYKNHRYVIQNSRDERWLARISANKPDIDKAISLKDIKTSDWAIAQSFMEDKLWLHTASETYLLHAYSLEAAGMAPDSLFRDMTDSVRAMLNLPAQIVPLKVIEVL